MATLLEHRSVRTFMTLVAYVHATSKFRVRSGNCVHWHTIERVIPMSGKHLKRMPFFTHPETERKQQKKAPNV